MRSKSKYFYRILLPSLLAVLMFMVAIYLFVIPNYRDSLLEGKRETIRELTYTAWSVMHKFDLMINEEFSMEEAQNEAALILGEMRWGHELKDYFWITDTLPKMVAHPYRPTMVGMDLSNYQDPQGKNFFVDIVNLVSYNDDGFIDYKWQWKDDSLNVLPKLSYVKIYEPWGWIVGTGIYIDDVKNDIANLTRRVVWISVLITLIIGAIILYLARRNFMAENHRLLAQERLRDSMVRYQKLVEASTDGVLMMMGNEIVYCNPYLLNLLGYSQTEFEQRDNQFVKTLESFVRIDNEENPETIKNSHLEISTEQRVMKKNGVMADVVVNRSSFEIEGKRGVIYAVKDVSRHKDVERELDLSMEKFKSIAGLMSLGVFRCTLGRQSRFVEINSKALELLGYSSYNELRNTHVQQLLEVKEEKKDVVQAINEGIHIKDKLLRLRRADGTILPALVSLFPVNDAHGKTVYCDGIIIDAYDHLCRKTDFDKSPSAHQLSVNVLLRPIRDFIQPAPHCSTETNVGAASKLLASTKADILLITDERQNVIGLLTHSDISRRIVATGVDIATPVVEIMSAPVLSVSETAMVMDAFSLMMHHGVSYIVVKPQKCKKCSYISLLALSELRKDTPEFLVNSIKRAESTYEINGVLSRLPIIIGNVLESGTGVGTTCKLISMISDTITEKYVNEMVSELGSSPAQFVFLSLGSEGRREQTLATDQDNAIVFFSESKEDIERNRKYFLKLGKGVCNALNETGYPFCKGGVMAMNNEWCMDIEEWEQTVSNWIEKPNPQEVLNTSIFFDFRPVYGDNTLASRLQRFCHRLLKDKNLYFYNIAQSTISIKPHSIEGSKDKEGYDIKLPILAIISIIRLWSLKYGVSERNTTERLYALESTKIFSTEQCNNFEQAFRYLMLMRIKNQLKQINDNEEVNNFINFQTLSEIEKLTLKKAINTITDHQSRMAMEFRVG